MPWGFAYAPRGPVAGSWDAAALGAFTAAVRDGLPATAGRVSHVRIDPEIEADGPLDPDGALRRGLTTAGWRPATPIQPNATRIIDLRADEDALWGDLRKKWRQYVNKARTGGIVVVDAGDERLGEFYRIYRETADRAGFLIRAESAYRDVWGAFAPTGNARLLFAQTADGDPQATLFLVRCGPRVVEPYGGMTAAGAESRANYLLKWEAIRSSREAGATSYDLWGLATGGIAHFKTGFGGREVRYIGAWDLVLSPLGRAGLRAGAANACRLGTPARRDHRRGERGGLRRGRLNVRDAVADELADWDAVTVEAPGGHVLQSRAWAEHRRAGGWQPRFLVADDGGRALALVRSWPAVPGGSAYLPRGPVPTGAEPAALGTRLIAFGDALAHDGIDVVAADPEVPDADTGFRTTIEGAGFRPIEEIQPSRHRISLALDGRTEEDGVRGRLQVDPPADPEGRGDGRARRPPRRARRARRAR